MAKDAITQDAVRELFDLDPETGTLIWKACNHRRLNGAVAGSTFADGYRGVGINGRQYMLHRIVWLHANGEIPEGIEVDHINGVRSDNRLSNLRLATRSTNMLNLQGAHKRNPNGLLGVTRHKCGKYQSCFSSKYLGLFATAAEAHSAYLRAKGQT